MARKKQTTNNKILKFNYKRRRISVILDKVLIFRLMRRLHGRFWGIAGITLMTIILSVCYLIRPDLLTPDAAISDFGTDVRTAPYFAAAMFIASYGLWRWRNYLQRTFKRKHPVSLFILLTILGLYMVALSPISWYPVGYRIHMTGMILAGLGIMATVIADDLLSKIHDTKNLGFWRFIRTVSFLLILIGGVVTFGSTSVIGWFDIALVGELMMIAGYTIWIYMKTYLGEGNRSELSKILKRIVLVD